MNGLLLTLSAALLCGLYAALHPWPALPWLVGAVALAIVTGQHRSATLLATAILGLLLGQACLEGFRHRQIQWLAEPEFQVLAGTIADLPHCTQDSCGFSLKAQTPDSAAVKVHWRQAPELRAGDFCVLTVTLKPIWSLLNPAGFDAETYAFNRQWVANANVINGGCRPGLGWWSRWQGFRDQLSFRLREALHGPSASLIPALVTGDRRGLSTHDWALLGDTGTAHLMAISGLHVLSLIHI